MITEVLDQTGKLITVDRAIELRNIARQETEPEPIYLDPISGETVLKPRSGSDTPLVTRRAHFYHPSDVNESGIGKERSGAIESLEAILGSSNQFNSFRKGVLSFTDNQMAMKHDVFRADFDYGFQVLLANKNDGKQYAVLVLNRSPHSREYLSLLKVLGIRNKFEGELQISKYLLEPGGNKVELNDTIYLATVQMMNRFMYRPNQESPHDHESLMLGDWQAKHLDAIYPDFSYFDPKTNSVKVVELEKHPHKCLYSESRYSFKGKEYDEEAGSDFCKKVNVKHEADKHLTLEQLDTNKNTLIRSIGTHPHLYLARIVPVKGGVQQNLFF